MSTYTPITNQEDVASRLAEAGYMEGPDDTEEGNILQSII